MSNENKLHDDENDETLLDGEDINSFFQDYNPESENTEDSEKSKENSRKEKMLFFGGDLTDIEAFLKHEEIRLKFLEFKLKKKTQIKDDESTYKDRKNERRLRKENAKKAFWFSSIWAVFIAVFIIVHGLKKFTLPIFPFLEFEFSVNEKEFMFVCGTLTASVLIFYLTVIKNLFPNKPEPNKNKESSEE